MSMPSMDHSATGDPYSASALPPSPRPRSPSARPGRRRGRIVGYGRRWHTQQVTRELLVRDRLRRPPADVVVLRLRRQVEQPFTGTRSPLRRLPSGVRRLLRRAQGLQFTNISFVDPADPECDDRQVQRHALITSTGRPYDQTYITEFHVRGDKVMAYTEYFDTFVLYNSLGLLDPPAT